MEYSGKRGATVLGIATLVLCLASSGWAGEPTDAATADTLFKTAVTLMEQGQHREACPLIEKSLKLDYGMAAQFRLAQCYDQLGQTASAQRNYAEVLARARDAGKTERIAQTEKALGELEPRLSLVVFVVPPALAALAGLALKRDGAPVERAQWGKASALDPNTYRLEASAPGHVPWAHELTVAGPGKTTVEVPMLARRADASPPPPPPPPPEKETSGWVPAGIAVGSVGLAVLAAGGILGLVAKSKHGGSEDYCLDDTDICSDDGIAIRSDARAMGTGATILLAVGAAGAVAGAVMWIAAPSTETPGGTEAAYVALLPAGPGAQLITGGCW